MKKTVKTKFVKITTPIPVAPQSPNGAWYNNRIGEVFEVIVNDSHPEFFELKTQPDKGYNKSISAKSCVTCDKDGNVIHEIKTLEDIYNAITPENLTNFANGFFEGLANYLLCVESIKAKMKAKDMDYSKMKNTELLQATCFTYIDDGKQDNSIKVGEKNVGSPIRDIDFK